MMQKSGEGLLAVQGSPKCISIASRERWLEIFVPSSWSDIGPRLIREVAGGISTAVKPTSGSGTLTAL
jgi:hypothetical protein